MADGYRRRSEGFASCPGQILSQPMSLRRKLRAISVFEVLAAQKPRI